MILSMTGFGAANIAANQVKGIVEIKTVNHRYLDIVYYLPSGFSSYEERIGKILSKELKRGRVTIAVKITEKPHVKVELNQEVVKQYIHFSKQLSQHIKKDNNLTVSDLLRLPGVIQAQELFVTPADIWPAVEKGIAQSLRSVMAMRRREGRAIKQDITNQLIRMKQRLQEIKKRINVLVLHAKKTLSMEEAAVLNKSNDINEEIERLAHHIDEAKALLSIAEGTGKKLDFIAQEMQREANTIGSKVQDKQVTMAVISLKSKIEKIREQANNVE